jgi:hypothetical protein
VDALEANKKRHGFRQQDDSSFGCDDVQPLAHLMQECAGQGGGGRGGRMS